jgi:hypothetical protein
MRVRADERGYLRLMPRRRRNGRPALLALLAGIIVVALAQSPGSSLGLPAKQAAVNGQYDLVLTNMGLRAPTHVVHTDGRCARFFTGPLSDFVANTPCRSIRRAVFTASSTRGARVVVSIAWVGFADSATAAAFAQVYGVGEGWVAPTPPGGCPPGCSRPAPPGGGGARRGRSPSWWR